MGEALFRQRCLARLNQPIEVRSAGTHALVGHSADAHAEKLMSESGLDISRHRGVLLSPALVSWADIILVMDLDQKRYIESQHLTARGKVFRLLEKDGRDIEDPYRQEIEVFQTALDLIQQGVNEWVENIS